MPRTRRSFTDMAAGWSPFGLGERKPKHFREMVKIAWENRDNLGYAWKVLSRGVCDGCALGTTGLKDWTISGTHLCMVRLELLRLNTMGEVDPARFADVSSLSGVSSKELRGWGRLGQPMRRRKGEAGFQVVSWDDVYADVGPRWRHAGPHRVGMFLTSRGLTNEVYYTAQKVMRYLGSNHVDNSARLCHSPSTAALKSTIGVAATTCSYTDWFDSDLIVFFGSNPANDQPVTTKYLHEARKRGARVIMVNAYREPGMERYWIPSTASSAVFGSKLTDEHVLVKVGGDLAFLNAVMKVVLDRGWHRPEFVDAACEGFDALKESLDAQPMDALLARAGMTLEAVEAFAREVAEADRGVFVWSMGITQHAHGSDTVRAIVNLGLLREFVGRPGTGMMPIRGHSGVQGGAEMGAYSTAFPGGKPIDEAHAAEFSRLWGFDVPSWTGRTTVEMLEAARQGDLDVMYSSGGNFLETMPEPDRVREALAKIPLRIHLDIVATNQMFVEPADTAYLLPVRTRYEQTDGGTETTTERRVVYSPHIAGHDVGQARSEWEILRQLAAAVKPESMDQLGLESGPAIRADIERSIPFYRGIASLAKQGDQFQWGGPRLCTDRQFPTSTGKAHFRPAAPPDLGIVRDAQTFLVTTRRGKQFNSMIQRDVDPLTGASRDHVFMSATDAQRLSLTPDQAIRLRSKVGTMEGRVFLSDVAEGTLQVHWPEGNVLLAEGRTDPEGGVPDYNAEVTVERLGHTASS